MRRAYGSGTRGRRHTWVAARVAASPSLEAAARARLGGDDLLQGRGRGSSSSTSTARQPACSSVSPLRLQLVEHDRVHREPRRRPPPGTHEIASMPRWLVRASLLEGGDDLGVRHASRSCCRRSPGARAGATCRPHSGKLACDRGRRHVLRGRATLEVGDAVDLPPVVRPGPGRASSARPALSPPTEVTRAVAALAVDDDLVDDHLVGGLGGADGLAARPRGRCCRPLPRAPRVGVQRRCTGSGSDEVPSSVDGHRLPAPPASAVGVAVPEAVCPPPPSGAAGGAQHARQRQHGRARTCTSVLARPVTAPACRADPGRRRRRPPRRARRRRRMRVLPLLPSSGVVMMSVTAEVVVVRRIPAPATQSACGCGSARACSAAGMLRNRIAARSDPDADAVADRRRRRRLDAVGALHGARARRR